MGSGLSETIRDRKSGAFTEADASSHVDARSRPSHEVIGRAPLSRASEVDEAAVVVRVVVTREHGGSIDAARGARAA